MRSFLSNQFFPFCFGIHFSTDHSFTSYFWENTITFQVYYHNRVWGNCDVISGSQEKTFIGFVNNKIWHVLTGRKLTLDCSWMLYYCNLISEHTLPLWVLENPQDCWGELENLIGCHSIPKIDFFEDLNFVIYERKQLVEMNLLLQWKVVCIEMNECLWLFLHLHLHPVHHYSLQLWWGQISQMKNLINFFNWIQALSIFHINKFLSIRRLWWKWKCLERFPPRRMPWNQTRKEVICLWLLDCCLLKTKTCYCDW